MFGLHTSSSGTTGRALQSYKVKATIHDMKLFFCHSSQDKPFVRELIASLPPSLLAWIDEDELLVGQNLKESLQCAINDSAFVVAVLSQTSIDSDWVAFELRTAMERELAAGKCVILPVVIDPIIDRLPVFITDRRFLTLHGRSRSQVELVSSELREGVALWALAHDPIAMVIKTRCKLLKAAAIEDGKVAAAIALFLPDLILKKIKAIYLNEVGGVRTDDYPAGWLIACMNTIVFVMRTSNANAAHLAEHCKQILDQCFLIGYYAIWLRRGIADIKVDDDSDFDAKEICGVVETLKAELESGDASAVPQLDIEAYNLGVRWVSMICEVLTATGIVPDNRETGVILARSMWYGTMVCRAAERHSKITSIP